MYWLEREREREIEKERNMDQLPPIHTLTGNWTRNLLVYRTELQPTESPGTWLGIAWNFRGSKKKFRCLPYHILFLFMSNLESFQLDKQLMNWEHAVSNPFSITTSLVLGWACKNDITGNSKRMGKQRRMVQKWAFVEKWRRELDLLLFLKCQFRKTRQPWRRLNAVS